MMKRRLHVSCFIWPSLMAALGGAEAVEITASEREFFEAKIRPVLMAECFECHAGKERKGGLLLDSRPNLMAGGDSGPLFASGDAEGSLLIASLRHSHEDRDLHMPKNGARLEEGIIEDFVTWIKMGAPDPRETAEPAASSGGTWEQAYALRSKWWSLQPLQKINLEEPGQHPIDVGIDRKRMEVGLERGEPADKRTRLRRLSFVLTGLPPRVEEIAAYLKDDSPQAWERAVDRYLASVAYGERWARHWMDLMRYAETHGSEGDPVIPFAWRYRDHLIRAFNEDVPYDQMVREHIAGDLLPQARWNDSLKINESLLATANLRLMEHGFQPVDSLDEQVKTVDNQIEVITKSFLGLTVSCARCHDHKFDAISQQDYYALYGIFASTRPGQVTLDSPEVLAMHHEALTHLKKEIRLALADEWRKQAETLPQQLKSTANSPGNINLKLAKLQQQSNSGEAVSEGFHPLLEKAAQHSNSAFYPWAALAQTSEAHFASSWQSLVRRWQNEWNSRREFNRRHFVRLWDLSGKTGATWRSMGSGLSSAPSAPGEFVIQPTGDVLVNGILPAGIYSHLLSSKHNGLMVSPYFTLETESLSVRLAGDLGGGARVIVDNYPLGNNDTYPQLRPDGGEMQWHRLDIAYRKGSKAYVEMATYGDLTRPRRNDATVQNKKEQPADDGRSWFGIAEVMLNKDTDKAPQEEVLPVSLLMRSATPAHQAELADQMRSLLLESIEAWREGKMVPEQQAWLNEFVSHGVLKQKLSDMPQNIRNLTQQYRELEAQLPVARRAPGPVEADGYDAALMIRGNHHQLDAPVQRRFLRVLGGDKAFVQGSGRLELAAAMTDAGKNPLFARVMVNRVWHWVFGRGLVATVDNFGRLGDKPTHPELLDWLAQRFEAEGYSIKKLVRLMVTSQTWQQSHEASAKAAETDAANQYWSHMPVRRLEAESIRDSMLQVSGVLNHEMFGEPVDDRKYRRSLYLPERRNRPHAFLEVFDRPKPATTRGQRDVTNIPAQSLTLMNDDFVRHLAGRWAKKLPALPGQSEGMGTRLRFVYEGAFGRWPTDEELALAMEYLGDKPDESAWSDYLQALFASKEFIYLR